MHSHCYAFGCNDTNYSQHTPQGMKKPSEEEVLFIGTQFSNLSTAVDTSAAAACNAWCVCVFFFFSSFFFWRPRILRMSPPLSFPAPQLSHFALHHPDLLQAPPQPYSLLHASTSAPPRPSGTSVSPPPSTQASTIHTLCDNLSTDKLNK
jgi:hypothetical protein